eukprot:5809934-Heterocapsa_arctica.AAC.1
MRDNARDQTRVTDKVERSLCGDPQNLFQYPAGRLGGRSNALSGEPTRLSDKHRRPCEQGGGQGVRPRFQKRGTTQRSVSSTPMSAFTIAASSMTRPAVMA